MISKEEFDTYKKTIFSAEDKKNYNKKVTKIRVIRYILWAIEILTAVIVLALNLSKGISMTVVFVLVACFMAFVFTTAITKIVEKKRLDDVRKEKIPKLMQVLVGEQLNSFAVDSFLPEDDFQKAGFGGRYDDYKGEDFIDIDIPKDNGKKSGVSFKACDLRVTREQKDSDGNTTTVMVYSGAFCSVDFPFEFKCKLAINSSLDGVKKFKLEDVSFNKTFQVFSDNQVEALCILTPSMMQKLVKLKDKTQKVKVSILKNHLYLGFPGFNLFEFGNAKDGLNESLFDDIYDDVALLLAIVDEIKRNNKVFKI